MKLFHSARSAYVRKVMVCAHEAGLVDRIELLPSNAHSVDRDQTIIPHNPLGQVPTMLLDDGSMLADSGVICAYLDSIGPGGLFPDKGPLRWTALVEQALGDGLIAAAMIARYETAVRPQDRQWDAWRDAHLDKVRTTLEDLEARAPGFGSRFDIGTITLACALSYLDFRFAHLAWRDRYPVLSGWHAGVSARPSMAAAEPV